VLRRHRPTQTKEALGAADVAAYLLAKCFGIGPPCLRAEPFEEGQGEGRLLGEIDRVEVEQVGFNGERVCAKGGAIADIGDGLEGFCGWAGADSERCDVDAISG